MPTSFIPTPTPSPLLRHERVIAHRRAAEPGPTLLCIGSLHGNEPAGTIALERIDVFLHEIDFRLPSGELLFLIGNIQALAEGRRFLDRDLNRGWRRAAVERVQKLGPSCREDEEMLALDAAIVRCQENARGPLLFLDLHTTSAQSPPFASVLRRGPALEMSEALPVPTVLGMDAHLDGTLLEELTAHDFCGIIFEGGQHDEPTSADHNEAATWMLLNSLGFLGESLPDALQQKVAWAESTLRRAAGHLPRLMQIEYRHPIDSEARFRMMPGLQSFEEIAAGQLLASDRGGEIRSDRAARILMPLYQAQGDDGFFLVRELEASDDAH